jgi:hypothetical protein
METQGNYHLEPRKRYRLSVHDNITATIRDPKTFNLIGEITGKGFKNLNEIQTQMVNMFGKIGSWVYFECSVENKTFFPNVIMINRRLK